MQGTFISFEGVDGAGKTTQVGLLADWWRARGREVVVTREPGGTALGTRLRALLLGADADVPIDARAEALLFAADRAQHAAEVIVPALERGAVVITDRYIDSSLAYQAGGRELTADEIRNLSVWAVQDLWPVRTYLLDLDPRIAAARMDGGPDRMEREGLVFQERTRAAFLALAEREPARFLTLDATLPAAGLFRAICEDSANLVG
ncbi:dTMP kinase [Bifidobacterium cuniculi]|uniref:Thymidylate kinase n=1 Tax=Bifidobacterium cuniculi TaxID=1688 RepID=A0A087AWU8_9BIFI|nr:dTMP kinase [Bifidobacterium cuniculi]KFI63248.1 thymidylate kinase [Bifidobacterium cuniculi]